MPISPEPGRGRQTLTESMIHYVDGDSRAFATLHRAIEPRVRARIRSLVGEHGPVDDLVQTTFLLAHRARHRWVSPSPPRDESIVAWFEVIAHNATMSERRRVAVRPGDAPCELKEQPSQRLDPERQLAEQQLEEHRRQVLDRTLPQLRATERDLIQRMIAGEPLCHAARAIGIQPVAARVRAHRARTRLRSLLSRTPAWCVAAGVGG